MSALGACLLGLTGCASVGADPGARENAPATEPTAQWQLVWSDEFAGSQIDTGKWAFDVDCWGGGNDEQQCYTDNPRNAAVRDGRLVITARDEQASGPAWPIHMRGDVADPDVTATRPFTSARLTTRGNASWLYGKIEIRARLPQGQGTWPAIWMLPEDDLYGGWARSGEIDILEAVNLGVACPQCPTGREDTILGTLHFGGAWPDNELASTEIHYPQVLEGFHTFGVVWSRGQFTWTVDGEVYATRDAREWFTTSSDEPGAPFDQRFHLILNLAIGGGLPERRGLGGVSRENFPKAMEIDWVRVWQCGSDPASPDTCAIEGS
ncbi:glycoside hydrolase family 16 protein [Alteraurantiacibacter aestuarii]|uniref:Family 16 glycosylhydrolase n=1 Tax=Alteraurantiacibacter aestuarii TaxID=650004 RepID=A0A844ZLL6_9SPHN|nr:glycoside hydrolase family 16 protein [Alteraurantiacibacter aestuarii]MXO88705.1 family 16 glycosylhydrolase [Alteraurantiacibacter aestuarii]